MPTAIKWHLHTIQRYTETSSCSEYPFVSVKLQLLWNVEEGDRSLHGDRTAPRLLMSAWPWSPVPRKPLHSSHVWLSFILALHQETSGVSP